MHITGNVYKNMKSFDGGKTNKVPLSVPVYIFDNRNEANKQAATYRSKSKDISQEVTIREMIMEQSTRKKSIFSMLQSATTF